MNIRISAKQELKCSKYLFIKVENNWISIENFIKTLGEEDDKILLTHKLLEAQRYLYRGKKVIYEELFNKKVQSLDISNFYEKFFRLELFAFEIKTHYLLKLISTLDRYINKARYELIKASSIIDIDYFNSDIDKYPYEWYYSQRFFNAENAIYSYYSIFEILMQIIWIYKDYFNGSTLKDALNYTFRKLTNNLLKDKDTIFLNEFSSTDEDGKVLILPKFKNVRDWCDKFKHRGILRFDGEEFDNMYNLKVIPNKEYKGPAQLTEFESADYEYEYIDLDYCVIPELIKYHESILKLSKKIISNIGLEENLNETL
jgi:hypothetical protein